MPVRRAKTPISDVSTVLSAQLRADLLAAAGGNALLSRTEQRAALPHIQDAADEIRAAGGAGARVTVDALEQNLTAKALRLIDGANQSSGPGAAYLSKAEAWSAFRAGGRVGEAVLRAYEVASGNGVDVDAVASTRVTLDMPHDAIFKTFATEDEAANYVEPTGKSVYWLVVDKSDLLKRSFVSGRNDLWVERFDIDRSTGVITITGEH